MTKTRLIVCGGRNYTNYSAVMQALNDHLGPFADLDPVVVTGGAPGADRLAERAAQELGLKTEVFPADWGKLGRAAGPIRNRQMLDAGSDVVIAFPGGRGTADMVRAARERGITVINEGDKDE